MARKVADGRWVVDREDDEWVTEIAPPAPEDEWTELAGQTPLQEGDEWRCSDGGVDYTWQRIGPWLIGRVPDVVSCPYCEFRRKEPAGGIGADEHSEER